jgi:hypothetical protein
LANQEFVHFFLFLAGATREELKPEEKVALLAPGLPKNLLVAPQLHDL